MSNRKITGIIKYGKRSYSTPVQKLQSGGFASVSKAYDWRDDPYEIMLLDQQSKQNIASQKAAARASSKKSSTDKVAKIGEIPAITGGLAGSNERASGIVSSLYNKYIENVQAGGSEYVGSTQGQLEHQNIINTAARQQELVTREFKNYEDALNTIKKEDREALAINSSGEIMVRSIEDPNKVGRVNMAEYTTNIDKYEAMSINMVDIWRRNDDTSMNSSTEDDFFRSGTVDSNSIYETFIKSEEDRVQFKIENGKLIDKHSNTDQGRMTDYQFKASFNNLLSSGDFEGLLSAGNKDPKAYIANAVETIFKEVMQNTATRSRLLASLQSEVLRDSVIVNKMKAKKTTEDKLIYLDKEVKRALVNRFIDKSDKKYDQGSGSEESGGARPKNNKLLAGIQAMTDGTKISVYSMGRTVTMGKGVQRNSYYNAPVIKAGISSADMGIIEKDEPTDEDRKYNRVDGNTTVNTYTEGEFYSESGYDMKVMYGSEFFKKSTTLDPTSGGDLTVIPYVDGKPALKKLRLINAVKIKSKEIFLQQMSKELGIDPSIKAIDLIEGGSTEIKQHAYKQYINFMRYGIEIDNYKDQKKEFEDSGKPVPPSLIKNLEIAKKAYKIIDTTEKNIKAAFDGKPVVMTPVYMFTILFDDDGDHVKKRIDEETKKNEYGDNLIKPATHQQEKYLQKKGNINHTNLTAWDDHAMSMKVFRKAKNPTSFSADNKDKVDESAKLGNIYNKIMEYVNNESFLANPDRMNTINFLIN